MWHQTVLTIPTRGRGTLDISPLVEAELSGSGIRTGLLHLFCRHTSAALVLCENADPDVRRDLEDFLGRLAVDGDRRYRHDQEGADDMAAHLRTTALSHSDLTIPVCNGRLALGTWQSIFLYEHRLGRFDRQVVLTLHGMPDGKS